MKSHIFLVFRVYLPQKVKLIDCLFFQCCILKKHGAKMNTVFPTDENINTILVPREYKNLGRRTDEDLTQPKSFATCV